MKQPVPSLDVESSPALQLAALVPESLARYRPVIVAGIDFFINHLPPRRREEIDRRWAALPAFAPVESRLFELLHGCPTLHKLGQVLARERRLPVELRRQLQRLESMPPWTPDNVICDALAIGLEGESGTDLRIAPEAIAEASVAVVVPFAWDPGSRGIEIGGVFKVLKPGIEERIEEELGIWSEVGGFLDEACERLGAPRLDYQGTIESVMDLLRAEVRLDIEQDHLRTAGKKYASLPHVIVPELLPFCTPRVTAMTRINGRKVTEAADLSSATRHQLARSITEALIVGPMLSVEDAAPFHADPHAGNLLATEDGRLGILDWSLVGHLTSAHREQMAQVLLGAVTRDATRIARAIQTLSSGPAMESVLQRIVDDSLERLPWPHVPGMKWFLDLLDAAVVRGRVRFDPNLILFRKALLMLEGVLADVDPTFDADAEIAACVLGQFAHEWPMRCFAHPASRAFGTHLSNADLAAACVSVSGATLRGWNDACIAMTRPACGS